MLLIKRWMTKSEWIKYIKGCSFLCEHVFRKAKK